MVIETYRQPMKASAMDNHVHTRNRGWPPRLYLGCNMTKSAGYSHESTEITKSSITPFGLIVERSANSRTVGVGQIFVSSCSNCVFYIRMMLITAPKSTSTC
jgi:hypothetical protein